ncbi:hypothetical protein MB828_16290 [Streptomyces arenae]|nr:hypothetical protein [Streptomyces arenae]
MAARRRHREIGRDEARQLLEGSEACRISHPGTRLHCIDSGAPRAVHVPGPPQQVCACGTRVRAGRRPRSMARTASTWGRMNS